METLELQHYAHKVGVNVHHLEWCTKYRYNMMRQEEYKNACENAIRQQADRHHICIRELFVMPEHVHVSCELPTTMSQSKALQLLKGGSSYLLFRTQPKFRLRYPRGHFWSSGAYAGSAGYNTVDIIDAYVRNKKDIHQKTLSDFTGSPTLKCREEVAIDFGIVYWTMTYVTTSYKISELDIFIKVNDGKSCKNGREYIKASYDNIKDSVQQEQNDVWWLN